jgi:peptidoglycan-associated lipoprotein
MNKYNFAVITLTSIFISACASTPTAVTTPESTGAPASTQEAAPNATASPTQAELQTQALSTQQAIKNQSIYFEMDNFSIAPKYQEVLQQQAERIKEFGKTVTLEGNADERGSSEYNLALGDKRANAVRKALEILGVPGNLLKSISLGEEKPKLSCHEEKCWAENRRVDFND